MYKTSDCWGEIKNILMGFHLIIIWLFLLSENSYLMIELFNNSSLSVKPTEEG